MKPLSVSSLLGLVPAVGLLALAAWTMPARAGDANLVAAGNSFSVPVTSLREARFKTILRQRYDFSCGSAAVASLLTYHYGKPTTEIEVFKAMFAAGDKEEIKRKGFSLLDMKNYLESLGYLADGFRVPLDKLATARIPAIVLVDIKGYKHFVVVKGVQDGSVLVGDPARGAKIYAREEFDELLANDIVFVIRSHPEVARETFNAHDEWKALPRAPVGAVRGLQDLAPITILLPTGRNEF